MSRKYVWLLFIVLLTCGCTSSTRQHACQRAAALNAESFRWRYRNIDSSLLQARSALHIAPKHSAERAEALCNLAFVAFQQMAYQKSIHLLGDVYRSTSDQTELLCADVLTMKVAQKRGDGYTFFSNRNHALKRISRIQEEEEYLTPAQARRFHYALTELHIVASTYYYYLGQDSAARAEIHAIDSEVSLQRDTTQWIYYHYMLGSGGLLTGNPDEVTMQEFHHLLGAYTTARAVGCVYFQANCLQSLASMLADTAQARMIRTREPENYGYLEARFMPDASAQARERLPMLLAERALTLFRSYKDLYQTACAYRTLGEIDFAQGRPQQALSHFLTALSLVEEQQQRDTTIVEPWMAGIHEKLSLAYSALDDKRASDLHRNAYLDLLDQSRQNRELDSRRDMLAQEVHAIHMKLLALTLLVVLVAALCIAYASRLRHSTKARLRNLSNVRQSPAYAEAAQAYRQCHEEWQERAEELLQECQAAQSHAEDLVQGNLERRAKVSLVYAIVPYLDRMRAEVNRMRQEHRTDENRLRYVGELAEEIMRINALLTEWIQVQRGQLSLHVSTFDLESVFHIIALGSHTFTQKGITLDVQPTDARVKADKALTMFMVNTLTDNARKFTPSGGNVTLQATATDQYVEISIQDSGNGLSADDVFTLNHSKVYDPKEIGSSQDGKGFGFGLMNCRGIIEKYRKTSAFFQVCGFGVESEPGRGSRFWFRLPRVMCLCAAMLMGLSMEAREATPAELFDSVYEANVQGRYQQAYQWAQQAVDGMGTPVDTALLVSLRNEMAIAALALKRWDDYRWQNSECVRLHRLYSQDSSLAAYCRQMEKISYDTNVLYVLMSLLSLVLAVLFYRTFLRGRLRSRKHFEQVGQHLRDAHHTLMHYLAEHTAQCAPLACPPSAQAAAVREHLERDRDAIVALLPEGSTLARLAQGLFEEACGWIGQVEQDALQATEQEEQLERYRFEENRLYVMNQILDNSLSTIKHETMYYPARTRQMVLSMTEGKADAQAVDELSDLLESYRQVYMLLYQQAAHQTEQRPPLRQAVPLQPIFAHVAQRMARTRCAEGQVPTAFRVQATSLVAQGDPVLLRTLLTCLATPLAGCVQAATLHAEPGDRGIDILLDCTGEVPFGVSTDELFTPASHCFPYLVARQAVREYDASCGHPGLRLSAESLPGGFCLHCTLVRHTGEHTGTPKE